MVLFGQDITLFDSPPQGYGDEQIVGCLPRGRDGRSRRGNGSTAENAHYSSYVLDIFSWPSDVLVS